MASRLLAVVFLAGRSTANLAGSWVVTRPCNTTSPMDQWNPDFSKGRIYNVDKPTFRDGTACLAASDQDSTVWLWTCSEYGGEKAAQEWAYTASKQIQLVSTKRCLEQQAVVPGVPPFVRLVECSSDPRQVWIYDPSTQFFTNSESGECLSGTGGYETPELLAGPASPAERATWRKNLQVFRDEVLKRIAFNGSIHKSVPWVKSSYIQPQVMMHDRYLYDESTHLYTIDRYLDDLQTRYGGIDSVLLWSSYPNIGIDDRNQFDFIRDLPQGISGLKAAIRVFHRRNVTVLWPWNPWDEATREEGAERYTALVGLLKEIGADGFFADTVEGVPLKYYLASVTAGTPMSIEPECCNLTYSQINFVPATWGYWDNATIPNIDAIKWIDRRHITRICQRWHTDRNFDIQDAFFNGAGYESWENVWGIWNGFTKRDGEALRRVSAILRFFSRFLHSEEWEPHTEEVVSPPIYGSKWVLGAESLWTLVNRGNQNFSGVQLRVEVTGKPRFFDCYHGTELTPVFENNVAELSFDIEGNGYGCVFGTGNSSISESFQEFLSLMSVYSARTLSSYDNNWKPILQKVQSIESAVTKNTSGMVLIPAADAFWFNVTGVEIEPTGPDVPNAVDFQYPWEETPSWSHSANLSFPAFYIDKFPVTNGEFYEFLGIGYQPTDKHNFLRHWKNATAPPARLLNKPVVWVSYADARNYCAWRSKRLPNEWEWQYAAQGNDRRQYPWGDQLDLAKLPTRQTSRTAADPDDVDAHPDGASPFGVMDLVGNVWQWTNIFVDERTRAAVLRGGSYYRPAGSLWYYPNPYELWKHNKYLLIDESYDRAATIGFRCAADLN